MKNVLDDDICKSMIGMGEFIGFTGIQTNKFKDEYEDKNVRTNTACVIDSVSIALKLYGKVKKHVLADSDNLYSVLRFTKYLKGDKMIKHSDAKFENQKIGDNYYDSNYTMLVFLSEFKGGELRIYTNNCEYYDIQPTRGDIIIFNHNVPHEVLEVSEGIRYNIRTDVLTLTNKFDFGFNGATQNTNQTTIGRVTQNTNQTTPGGFRFGRATQNTNQTLFDGDRPAPSGLALNGGFMN